MPLSRARLRDRSTGDLLVLLVAGTVCFTVLGSAAAIILAEALRPEGDTASAAASVSDVINTLIGLLAGFLAGRSDTALTVQKSGLQQQPEIKP
jgi:hypothetical protein